MKLENLDFDYDFRGDQYFLRVYYKLPIHNTRNNIKEVERQIMQALSLQDSMENCTIDMTEREHSLIQLLLQNSRIQSESKVDRP